MCGIAGVFDRDGAPVAREDLERMLSFLRRRGPDHAGTWVDGGIGLAHARLSIIDLSPAGNQPMTARGGELVVTHNGEIYNYKELRGELAERGCEFRSASDTEVLLHGCDRWGIDGLLRRIDGMYAFVLVDRGRRAAHLCRDPFGKKPLYYAMAGRRLLFASDIRSVATGMDSLEIDPDSLDHYLSELAVPQPRSIWRGIRQVRPGHRLTVDLETHRMEEAPHWKLEIPPRTDLSYEEAERLVEESLGRAIVKRTVADVPLGAFLSGGTDSGLVVALLAERSAKPVRTFSIGFREDDFSELPHARRLAERYRTDHTEIVIEPRVAEALPEVVAEMGEPFADPGAVTSFMVSREAARHVRVALSGDGGDELFGYPNYVKAWRADSIGSRLRRRVAEGVRRWLPGVIHREGPAPRDRHGEPDGGAPPPWDGSREDSAIGAGGGGGAPIPAESRRLLRGMGFSREEKRMLYGPALRAHAGFTELHAAEIWRRHESASIADTLFRASLETRLLNDYLVKVDRASMMSSIEVRCPFLDRDLVPLALSLPNRHKFEDGRAKYLLRRLASRRVDASILGREKRGFGLPLGAWLAGELRPMVGDLLGREAVRRRGLFDPGYVERIVAEHAKGERNHARRIWALICLELWQRGHEG